MKKVIASVGLVLLSLLVSMTTAQAAAVTLYDASLTTPPGWYDGSGNPNGGFTIVDDNGIELGLRAKYRQNPNVIDTPNNVYTVVLGPETPATSGGPSNPARASWNYEFSVNLNPTGLAVIPATLNSIEANSTITIQDVTQGTSDTQGLFAFATDDSFFGPSGVQPEAAGEDATDWGAQNSENPVFANFGIPFNENSADLYRITVNIANAAGPGGILDSDSIDIQAVPEPTSLVLLASGLFGIGFKARQRCKQQ